MGDRITAEPERLDAYAEETLGALPRARAAVDDHEDALRRYLSAPSDIPPACHADPSGAIRRILDDLEDLDRSVQRLADDLRVIDDGGSLASSAWNLYAHPTGAYSAATTLVNVNRYVSTTSRLRTLERYRDLRAPDLRWTGMNRAARRAEARALNRLARRQLPAVRVTQRAAQEAMEAKAGFGWTAGIRSRVAARVPAATRALPALGRGLGIVGVVVGGFETYRAIEEGDATTATFKAAGMVGGAVLLAASAPVTLTAGAVLVGASLAYEYKDEIAAGARWAGRKLSSGVSTVKGWFGG